MAEYLNIKGIITTGDISVVEIPQNSISVDTADNRIFLKTGVEFKQQRVATTLDSATVDFDSTALQTNGYYWIKDLSVTAAGPASTMLTGEAFLEVNVQGDHIIQTLTNTTTPFSVASRSMDKDQQYTPWVAAGGNTAKTADALTTPQKFNVTGYVTASAVEFDGTKPVTLDTKQFVDVIYDTEINFNDMLTAGCHLIGYGCDEHPQLPNVVDKAFITVKAVTAGANHVQQTLDLINIYGSFGGSLSRNTIPSGGWTPWRTSQHRVTVANEDTPPIDISDVSQEISSIVFFNTTDSIVDGGLPPYLQHNGGDDSAARVVASGIIQSDVVAKTAGGILISQKMTAHIGQNTDDAADSIVLEYTRLFDGTAWTHWSSSINNIGSVERGPSNSSEIVDIHTDPISMHNRVMRFSDGTVVIVYSEFIKFTNKAPMVHQNTPSSIKLVGPVEVTYDIEGASKELYHLSYCQVRGGSVEYRITTSEELADNAEQTVKVVVKVVGKEHKTSLLEDGANYETITVIE